MLTANIEEGGRGEKSPVSSVKYILARESERGCRIPSEFRFGQYRFRYARMTTTAAINRLPETNGNVVTSWIPLESAWPQQPDCTSALWNYYKNIVAAWDPGYGVSANTDVTCHPKAVTTWWLQERLGPNTETVVSLGPINCPEDYYTATERVQDSSSTLVACCPS